MMTKQHFELIAECLDANMAPLELVQDFADMCGEENPRFNRPLFIAVATKNIRKQLDHELGQLNKELTA